MRRNHEMYTSISEPGDEIVQFACNICGAGNSVPLQLLERDNPSCKRCGSSVRMRSVIHLLSMELFGESVFLKEFPQDKSLAGMGMSDWRGYARVLSRKFSYTNTFYHRTPSLDIRSISGGLTGKFDFIISSDVLEHVEYPVSSAFRNLHAMLKPGGVLIFTAPYGSENPETIEHFPGLYEYRIERIRGKTVLLNTTREGQVRKYEDLVFHGGVDSPLEKLVRFVTRGREDITLEMRIFSEQALVKEFQDAGFVNLYFFHEEVPRWGILWKVDWGLPLVARKDATLNPSTGLQF